MRGRVLFNGNIGGALLDRAAPWVRGSAGGRTPRVLLLTAAWGPNEYDEGQVKAGLEAIGIPREVGGVENIQNSSVWHTWADFLGNRPDVAEVWSEIRAVGDEVRGFYLEKTKFHADLIRRGVRTAREKVPGFALGAVHERDPIHPEAVLRGPALLERALGRELIRSIEALVDNDARMMEALTEAEEQLLARTGLRLDPQWRATRAMLEERILAADTLFLFGGSPTKLLEPLRFFDLRPALLETLRRGATLVATSAGALVLCERMIVYDDYAGDPNQRDFRLLDRGLGLVGGLQILPHCMDRIQTDDADNLAYLARRFSARVCAGLNEESFLLVEMEGGTATSVGEHDGVYVFGANGVKTRYDRGERIDL